MGAPGLMINPVLHDINWENGYDSFYAHSNTHIFNEALVHYIAANYPDVCAFGLNPGLIFTSGFMTVIGNPFWAKVAGTIIDFLFQTKEEYIQNVLVPLLVLPDVKSGFLFNSVGNEIVPNSWLAQNITARSFQLVNLNEELLRKYNLTE